MAERTVDVEAAMHLIDSIKPLLAGHPPAVIGAALAELVAIFVRGHHAEMSERGLTATVDATLDLRREILELHVEAVRELAALP